jgi:proteasome accessory factor C
MAAKKAPVETAAQLGRLLALAPRFADGEDHALTEIAELLGVDADTVVRDLMSFGGRSAPGGFVEGLEVFIDAKSASVKTDHFLRPMRLTIAELRALELGLGMIRAERDPGEWRAIDGAREHIRKAVAKLPKDEIDAAPSVLASAAPTPPHLGTVREALQQRRKLRVVYQRVNASEPTSRIVRPYRLILAGPVWYLLGFCEKSMAIRVFRVDRMEKATVLPDKFAAPDLAAIDEQVAKGPVFVSDAPVKLRVRFSPKIARWLQERESGTVEADGSFVVEYPLADLDWGVRHVLQYGAEAEILEPPEARKAIVERLKAIIG